MSIQCPTCEGSGIYIEDHGYGQVEQLGCQNCQGTGRVPDLHDHRQAQTVAIRDLVVAVDRYVDHHNEVDPAVHDDLWRAMCQANERVADLFNVYPLRGGEGS